MGNAFLAIATTDDVRAAQTANGSRGAYARREDGPVSGDRLGPAEAAFIARRDSFYLATVSETGWPYVQHRGGPPGFIRVLDGQTLGIADYRGNRQYLSLGNVAGNDRVALFLMDYPNRRRLKVFARMSAVDLASDPELTATLVAPGYGATVERGLLFKVEGVDWNCPQHITPRFSEAEVAEAVGPMRRRLEELEAENGRLRGMLEGAERP